MLATRQVSAVVISGGRVIDPTTGRNEVADIAVVDGKIAATAPADATVIDATNWIVCPGLIDIHVHLREPGRPDKETIATGTAAAAAGGFTAVACMPNTTPTIDTPEVIRDLLARAHADSACEVLPIAAITRGRKGNEVVDFDQLKAAGAAAFSDDGDGVERDELMRIALSEAKRLGFVAIQHCEYRGISSGGVMHAGEVASKLGVPGLDPKSEEAMVKRDLDLVRETAGRYHVSHVSTANAVQMVRQAKRERLPVTAEVTPHHLALTLDACSSGDANTKMHPPLRTLADVAACRAGLVDGTIDCVATDHAPHTVEEKAKGMLAAPPGIVGLETAIGVVARAMIDNGLADWPDLIHWMSTAPAHVLDIEAPTLRPGANALIALIDPKTPWTVDPTHFNTLGRNTPFAGQVLSARAIGTLRGVELRFVDTAAAGRLPAS